MIVRCRSCYRSERWTDAGRAVEAVGGSRRSPTPERDAFDVLAKSLRGELGPVVERCPACGGPMVADGDVPRIDWTIATPGGPIRFAPDGTIAGPGDLSTLEAAERVMREAFPEAADPPMGMMKGSVFVLMLAPVALWLLAAFFVVMFLTQISVGP